MSEQTKQPTSTLATPPKQFIPPADGETIVCNNTHYYLSKLVGQGSFGDVYDCTDEWSNRLVAKVLLPQNRTYEQVKDEWLGELQNLSLLRHPNITFIHQAFEYRNTFYLIVEKCAMTLDELIHTPSFGGAIWLPYVARDILHGLDYIHNNNYVHKDLHAGNIFVSQQYDLMVPEKDPVWSFKIGDLGISRLEENIEWFNTILAKWMLPPEYLNQEFGVLGKHVDIYHVGLLLLRMLSGEDQSFSQQEILDGVPSLQASQLASPYAQAISRALQRNVPERTQSALDFWREIFHSMPKGAN